MRSFKISGEVFMMQPEWYALLQAMEQEDPPAFRPTPLSEEDGELETRLPGGRLVVATDGACSDASVPMLRRAGAGVSFGRGHSQSCSWWLPGPQQSAQRAEVFAIYMLVTRLVWAPVHI
eukprot:10854247-Alexandrium_andersonii.AAC.1